MSFLKSHANQQLSDSSISLLSSMENPDNLFEILEVIGSGSYGEVYKACMVNTGQVCAIKSIPVEQNEEISLILNEIKIIKNSSHANVVTYLGCYWKKGSLKGENYVWIVMEYCAGGSVEHCYKQVGFYFCEIEICCILRGILRGISYLHGKGQMHRDLKAANILLTDNGDAKLADFGVSTQLTKTLMKKKTFIGTPYWMAPEVILSEDSGDSYDLAADIWSVGITAIEIACKKPPLYDLHPMRVLFLIPKLDPPTLPGNEWSEEFVQFISACLIKDSKKRPSVSHLLQHQFFDQIKEKDSCKIIKDLLTKIKQSKQDIQKKLGVQMRGNGFDEDKLQDYLSKSGESATFPLDVREAPLDNDNIKNSISTIGSGFSESILNTFVVKELTDLSSNVPYIPHTESFRQSITNQSSNNDNEDNNSSNLTGIHPHPHTPIATATAYRTIKYQQSILQKNLNEKFICGRQIDGYFVYGNENGLFGLDSQGETLVLSRQSYFQIDLISHEYLIGLCGIKNPCMMLLHLEELHKKKKIKKNELSLKVTKIPDSKGASLYCVIRNNHDQIVRIAVFIDNVKIVFYVQHKKYADKFIKVKEFYTDIPVKSINFLPGNVVRLCVISEFGIRIIDTFSWMSEIYKTTSSLKLSSTKAAQSTMNTNCTNVNDMQNRCDKSNALWVKNCHSVISAVKKYSAVDDDFCKNSGEAISLYVVKEVLYLVCFNHCSLLIDMHKNQCHKIRWSSRLFQTCNLSNDLIFRYKIFIFTTKLLDILNEEKVLLQFSDSWKILSLNTFNVEELFTSSDESIERYFFDTVDEEVFFIYEWDNWINNGQIKKINL